MSQVVVVTGAGAGVGRATARAFDRYLGRRGVDAQQTQEPADRDRAHNLWHPVPGDHGAHGAFDDRSRTSSPAVWASIHRRSVTATAGLAAVALGLTRKTHP